MAASIIDVGYYIPMGVIVALVPRLLVWNCQIPKGQVQSVK